MNTNELQPLSVEDSVRIAKGIALTGFPAVGVISAALFLLLPMPWPAFAFIVGIVSVLMWCLNALTKEREEIHRMYQQKAERENEAHLSQLRMLEANNQAGLDVWKAQQLFALGAPAQQASNPIPASEPRKVISYITEPDVTETHELNMPSFVQQSNGRKFVRNEAESSTERAARIGKLAKRIWLYCRDRNPSQRNILDRIPMESGGLLRSNEDMTEALDLLAIPHEGRAFGWITPKGGKGIKRLWLHQETGQVMDYEKSPAPLLEVAK